MQANNSKIPLERFIEKNNLAQMKTKYCKELLILLCILKKSLRHIKIFVHTPTQSVWFGYFLLHPVSNCLVSSRPGRALQSRHLSRSLLWKGAQCWLPTWHHKEGCAEQVSSGIHHGEGKDIFVLAPFSSRHSLELGSIIWFCIELTWWQRHTHEPTTYCYARLLVLAKNI